MYKHLEMIQNLVDTIEENVGEDINVIELSQTFNLSPWHFQRLFKTLVGDSLGGYIRGRRLSRGADMLLQTPLSIIQIAFEVGFSSHESFTRSFKSYFNFSPKNFRKERPSVLLNTKPQLNDALLAHITDGMNQEPTIVDVDEQYIIGFDTQIPSPFHDREEICEYVATQWFALFERENEIPHATKHTYYGLSVSESGTFTETMLRYIAGVPVSSYNSIAEGMKVYHLPKQKVAMFDTKTNIGDDVTKRTIDYIYGYWLANSKYQRAQGDDYELFENVVDFRTGDFSSKYVIPIIER